MKYGIRIILCAALCAVALTLAVFTLSGFSTSGTRTRTNLPAVSEGSFVLGEVDGNVAVFAGGDMETPISVTNIELAQLREADRDMISAGLIADSETELMQLLEDLGS